MFGNVHLVGAGPGDPELLTLKALRLIETAGTVVFDRLVSSAILDLIPPGAERHDVGKRAHHHPVPQDEINVLLVRLARSGRDIVRLKGGDPFLFGRGGEEVEYLRRHGIACSIVPGITSAQGAAAVLGMPLTQRTLASGLRLVTGHCRADGALDFDWYGLADPATTLVIYMGLATIPEITSQLITHGRDPVTPALAVASATLPGQRQIVSTLARIAADTQAAGLSSPVLFFVGEIVQLAQMPAEEVLRDAQVLLAAE